MAAKESDISPGKTMTKLHWFLYLILQRVCFQCNLGLQCNYRPVSLARHTDIPSAYILYVCLLFITQIQKNNIDTCNAFWIKFLVGGKRLKVRRSRDSANLRCILLIGTGNCIEIGIIVIEDHYRCPSVLVVIWIWFGVVVDTTSVAHLHTISLTDISLARIGNWPLYTSINTNFCTTCDCPTNSIAQTSKDMKRLKREPTRFINIDIEKYYHQMKTV